MSDDIRDIEWTLRYRHGEGEFGPYFAALREGRALASLCSASGRVEFPPHPGDGVEWVALPGTGRVVAATHGPVRIPLTADGGDWTFALIAMDGADNLALGRVADGDSPASPGQRVRIAPASEPSAHPATGLLFEPIDG